MATILVTDAVGLVGSFTINVLLQFRNSGHGITAVKEIRAGYHKQDQLDASIATNAFPGVVIPTMVDWERKESFSEALRGVDAVLLLTPFTSAKVLDVQSWIEAACSGESDKTSVRHIVHVGVHCDEDNEDDRARHETWQLRAEQAIRSATAASESTPRLSWTFLRINFDGYNGVLKPGRIAYFLPRTVRYGWIAREDIAEVAARALLHPEHHVGKTYRLATELLSLDDMATIATKVCGFDVKSEQLTADDFERLALSPLANPENNRGYVEYMTSVKAMFQSLADGGSCAHQQHFPEVFLEICGRHPMSFEHWLLQSSYTQKLGVSS